MKKLWPLWMLATFLPSLSNCTSLEGSSRMMVKSRRAGRVVAPASVISASTLQRTPTSRSVVVMLMPLPLVWSRTLERMGSVVRVLTTLWTCCKPSRSFSLLRWNFMRGTEEGKPGLLKGGRHDE